jgi:L-asparagine transporter-like permease
MKSMSVGWVLVGMVVLSAVAAVLRKVVRRDSASYRGKEIVIVGLALGLLFAAVAQVMAYYLVSSWAAAIPLFIWGLIVSGYIGYEPGPFDKDHNAHQVAGFAASGYVVLTLAAVATRILM